MIKESLLSENFQRRKTKRYQNERVLFYREVLRRFDELGVLGMYQLIF